MAILSKGTINEEVDVINEEEEETDMTAEIVVGTAEVEVVVEIEGALTVVKRDTLAVNARIGLVVAVAVAVAATAGGTEIEETEETEGKENMEVTEREEEEKIVTEAVEIVMEVVEDVTEVVRGVMEDATIPIKNQTSFVLVSLSRTNIVTC